jgi:hypothetical protein
VYATENEIDSPAARRNIVSGTLVPKDPSSKSCFATASKWIQDCLGNHAQCPKQTDVAFPTRLIDVGPSDGTEAPCLKLTHGLRGTYIALSHRWGTSKTLTTTTDSLQERLTGIPMHSLPKTFQDAIRIVRGLNMRFLWIDSLCILQDSVVDWAKESANMGNIYSNAVVTIFASNSTSSMNGILKPRLPKGSFWRHLEYPLKLPCNSLSDLGAIYVREPLTDFDYMVESKNNNTLKERGWILQEQVLSPRTICYTAEQMFWQCGTCSAGEGDTTPIEYGLSEFRLNNKLILQKSTYQNSQISDSIHDIDQPSSRKQHWQDPYSQWMHLVNDYSTRKLTNPSDLFPALSGIAQEVQRLPETHIVLACGRMTYNEAFYGQQKKPFPKRTLLHLGVGHITTIPRYHINSTRCSVALAHI